MNSTSRYSYSRNGDRGRVDEKCLVRVQIPNVDTSDGGNVRYHVRVTNLRCGKMWEVLHRFSEFLELRNELIDFFDKTDKKCPGCRNYEKVLNLFEFPRKHVFTSVTPVVIKYRKTALCNFIALLVSHTFTNTPKCPTCSAFPFTRVRDWLTTDMAACGVSGSTMDLPTTEAFRDTMNVKDFTDFHPVSNESTVDQDGRFVGTATSKHRRGASRTRPTKSSPSRPEHRLISSKKDSKLQPRYDDGDLSIESTNSLLSPPSVDEFVVTAPLPIKQTHMLRFFEDNVKKEDEEEKNCLVSSSAASSQAPKHQKEQLSSDSNSLLVSEIKSAGTAFKFANDKDFDEPNERTSAEIIGFDHEENKRLNLDFMNGS
ncbi:uncharacterized protein CCR75_001521 [Bremia lactucae]|uniref:PX domain-containing protein n=1 Tax=Bremia lactucae TaxID=4779 RepID=A0A976IAR9_BRELC|nr:hypothetical protein CCR75_001521 [Bremia lactucae]